MVVPTSGAARALLSVEEARIRVLAGVAALPAETVALEPAAGRVLSEPVAAAQTLPAWDNSAMDGFAVRSEDVVSASPQQPVTLRVAGESAAGHPSPAPVAPGTAIRISTGAMLPAGADAVVPVEETDAPAGARSIADVVRVMRAAPAGNHVRRRGEDVHAGERLLDAGRAVGPAALALLAAAGVTHVSVHRAPRVAVLATGDELVPLGSPLGPGAIYDSNSIALAAQARAARAEVRRLGLARDTLEAVLTPLREAAGWADVIVTSGGVSVGAHDVVRDAFAALGEVDFWRVAVQPGKPLAYGRAGGCHLFGLPGNPVSAFVTFELFVRPLLRQLAGRVDLLGRTVVRARLAQAVTKSTERRAFLRVRLEREAGPSGGTLARLAGGQGSHVLSALAAADGLAIVPEGLPGLSAGSEVDVWTLDDEGA